MQHCFVVPTQGSTQNSYHQYILKIGQIIQILKSILIPPGESRCCNYRRVMMTTSLNQFFVMLRPSHHFKKNLQNCMNLITSRTKILLEIKFFLKKGIIVSWICLPSVTIWSTNLHQFVQNLNQTLSNVILVAICHIKLCLPKNGKLSFL